MAAAANNEPFAPAHPIGLMLITCSRGAFLKNAHLLILVLSLGCTLSAAQNRNPSASAVASDPVYQKNCAKCHGKTAEGRRLGGPSLVSAKTSGMSVGDLRTMIDNGKGRMPKFAGKLEPADIDRLVMEIKAATQK